MRGLALQLRPGRLRAVDALAGASLLVYASGLVYAVRHDLEPWLSALIALPFVLAGATLLSRRRPSGLASIALGAGVMLGLATALALTFIRAPLVGWAIPGMAIVAYLCAKRPAVALSAVFLLAGSYGSLLAFFSFPSQRAIDGLLAGLWLAAIWGWAISGRRRPTWMWPGIAALSVYVVLSAFEILTAESTFTGMQSFRGSIWYIAAALLIAYAPWPAGTRTRLLRAFVLIALAVGGYATLRWAIGPAADEEALAATVPNNFLDKELRPVGSFRTTKELACWTAVMVPFAAGIAVTARGWLRFAAAAAMALCVVGMLAADVRAGPASAAPGVAAVIALYQLSQAFRGRRGPMVAIAVAVAVIGGAGAFTLTLSDQNDSSNRYRAILDPTSDASFKARVVKWNTAINDIEEAPLGHGLGSAGRTQVRYGKFTTIGSVDVDNSYLKIAYEQGFFVMALFVVAVLLVLLGLVRRVVVSTDPARAGPAIAACGTLVAMLVIFFVGDYVEGLPALAGWLVVGIGISQYTLDDSR